MRRKHVPVKLDAEIIEVAHESGMTYAEIAEHYGVSVSTIQKARAEGEIIVWPRDRGPQMKPTKTRTARGSKPAPVEKRAIPQPAPEEVPPVVLELRAAVELLRETVSQLTTTLEYTAGIASEKKTG